MSCESAFSIISDLWKEYGEQAKKIGCAAAGIATANPATVVACVEASNKAEEVASRLLAFWNKMAGNSWAKIGHRSLEIGKAETGTLTLSGDRMFITTKPLGNGTYKFSLDETDGKGETAVDVSLSSISGKCEKLKSYLFNEDKSGKQGHGNVELDIKNAGGKYLVVLLNGKSITNKFSYKIKLEKVTTAIAKKATATATKA